LHFQYLVVEVVSPGDRASEVQLKTIRWLKAGTPLVWIVEPDRQTITVYRPEQPTRTLKSGEFLTGDPVLPGFTLSLAELFA